jgi:hypothetical protein
MNVPIYLETLGVLFLLFLLPVRSTGGTLSNLLCLLPWAWRGTQRSRARDGGHVLPSPRIVTPAKKPID